MTGLGGLDTELRALRGRTIDDRYLLRDWIDEGNFGAVFAAEQRMLGVRVRKVAVKIRGICALGADDSPVTLE